MTKFKFLGELPFKMISHAVSYTGVLRN